MIAWLKSLLPKVSLRSYEGAIETRLDASQIASDKLEKALSFAIETRKSEIDRFWSRTLVFWGFTAAAFIAFAASGDSTKFSALEHIMIACFGLITSAGWSMQNRGSKYWQEVWEKKVEVLEITYFGIGLFSAREPLQNKGWLGAHRFSVSKIAIVLSDATTALWLIICLDAIHVARHASHWAWLWFIPSVLAAAYLWLIGRTSKP